MSGRSFKKAKKEPPNGRTENSTSKCTKPCSHGSDTTHVQDGPFSYTLKFESYQPHPAYPNVDTAKRGSSGPMQSRSSYCRVAVYRLTHE